MKIFGSTLLGTWSVFLIVLSALTTLSHKLKRDKRVNVIERDRERACVCAGVCAGGWVFEKGRGK